MEYKVTCSNCGQQYRLTAAGGQTVWSKCPNCGHKMLVNLPSIDGAEPQVAVGSGPQQQPEKPKKKRSKWMTVLLALVLGVVLGVGGWLGWQQKQKNDAQAEIDLKNERKAHMDSLMQLRNHEEAEERQAQQLAQDQQDVISFLNDFYQDCLFSDGDPDRYANNISESCYQKLTGDYGMEENDSTSNEINWQMLGPRFESSRQIQRDIQDIADNFEVTHYHDNWYKIRFSAHGTTEYRQVEAFKQNNKIIINDFR